MRILSIKLKNINSLRGEFELDFTKAPLKDAGLFAMIGKMGSGKSTILDAITLALYNAIPRYTKVSKDAIEKGGLILTKNERDCYAEVKYSCKTGVFTSKWSIKKTRNNTYGDYDMRVYDENEKPVTEKKTEVPATNERLIGLDYDQFSKAILLSQGEFARFLKSTKNERAQLLEEITATKDFRRLGRLAYFVFGRKKKEIDGQLELIKSLEVSLISEQELATLGDTVMSDEVLLADTTKKLELVKSKIDTKSKLSLLQKEIGQKKEKLEIIKQRIKEFDLNHAATLAQYEQLLPYKEQIREHGLKHQELVKLQNSVSEKKRKLEALTERMDMLVNELSAWVNKVVTANTFFEALDLFKEAVLTKIERRKQVAEDSLSSAKRVFATLQQSFFSGERSLFNKAGDNASLINGLRERLKDQERLSLKHLEAHSLKESQLPFEKARLQDSIRDLELLEADVRSYLQSNKRIKENALALDALEKVLLESSRNAVELHDKQKELEHSFELAEKDRQEMLTEEKLNEYRLQLREGEPCPLCGAESHPYVHEYAKDLGIVEDQYHQIKALLETKRRKANEAVLVKSSKEIEIQSLQKVLERDHSDLQTVKERIDIIKKKQAIDNIGSEDLVRKCISDYKSKFDAVENCLEHLVTRPLIEQLVTDLGQLENSSNENAILQKEIDEMYTGSDIQSDVQQRRVSMQSAIEEKTIIQLGISSSILTINELEARIAAIAESILTKLQQLGYMSIALAGERIITETLFHELTSDRNSLNTSLQSAESILMEDEKRIKRESANDDSSLTLESLVISQQEFVQIFNDQTKTLEDHRLKWRMEEEAREKIKKINEEIKGKRLANYPWELLCNLIGDKTGNSFNNYAQELTLKHLLNFANKRLLKLHSRYILSMWLQGEEEDLAIVDTHMGNERRSVKTLSGGETFIISLALALGLSDLASRDVLIESLFIDEGFGTLDPEVLETTIGTLEQLQAESNKTVGIISHVDSMKERIFTQVQLEKQTNGFSTMRIYPES